MVWQYVRTKRRIFGRISHNLKYAVWDTCVGRIKYSWGVLNHIEYIEVT